MNTALPTVHILYENPDWLPPLEAGLSAEGFEVELHEIWRGVIDIAAEPAPGIYINRMSPSSHTRGHDSSVGLMRETLAWLEAHGRRVVNGSRAFEIEMSKLRQDLVLRRHGIRSPRTLMAVGTEELVRAAATFDGPFITKHNQGGKGLGIQLFSDSDQLAAWLETRAFDPGPRSRVLVQQYIEPAEPFITRVEISGGRFLFAMRSSTEEGFELCPSDACQLPPASAPEVCPVDGAQGAAGSDKFTVAPLAADDPLVEAYIRLCAAEGIELAGIEFVTDKQGVRYTYDINGTTNYNSAVERAAGIDGMRELARHIKATV